MICLRPAAILALATVASSAAAFEPAYDYATLRAGLFVPSGSSVRAFGRGLDAELSVGRAFLPFLAGEIAVGLAQSGDTDRMWGGYRDPVSGQQFDTFEHYALVPLTLTLKAILPAGSVEPYLGGGAGVYFARLEKEPIGSSSTVKDSDTVTGLHVCGGAMVHLTARFFSGFDARYLFAKVKYFQGGQVAVNGLRITAMAGLQF